MKYMLTLVLGWAILATTSCKNADSNEQLYLNDFHFTGYFGHKKGDNHSNYCLLGKGYFRTPRSENADSLIAKWMKQHAKATVIPISSFGPTEMNDPDSKMIYCWLIDQNDTLNNYLIRKGCFPGGTMMRPKTLDEMSTQERKLYEIVPGGYDIQVYINNKTYSNFVEQIKSAEQHARDYKLGIWQNADHDEE